MWKQRAADPLAFAYQVSVPLRGLDMWKLEISAYWLYSGQVSVPLRGLDMWKRKSRR